MRRKKMLQFLVIGIVVVLITILHINIILDCKKNDFVLKNAEALADKIEDQVESDKKICNAAGGLCFINGREYAGIHVAMD